MNRFTADYSSSPANTPPRNNPLLFHEPNPSTTPLVPPPSTVFGSSRLGSGKTLFTKAAPPSKNQPFSLAPSSKAFPPTASSQRSRQQQSPQQPKFNGGYSASAADDEEDYEDGYEEENDGPVAAESLMKFSTNSARPKQKSVFKKSTHSHSVLPNKGNADMVANFARGLMRQAQPAPLQQEDSVILDTEVFLQDMDREKDQVASNDKLQELLDRYAHDLQELWKSNTRRDPEMDVEIGPPSKSTPFDKAYYLSSLLFTLHHSDKPTPSEALLAWLEENHVSYDFRAQQVANSSPNPTAHQEFWEVVLSLTLRGRLQAVMHLLQQADFQYAASAMDDGEQEAGFHGAQLQTIQSIIFRVRQVINSCPALNGNWDTSSDAWAIYRGNVEVELDNLGQLASGEQGDEDDFEAPAFGIRKPQRDLLRKSQRSRNLPWSIYQGIRVLYGILIGSSTEIISQSQDWLEASCALTIWWDGASESKITNWSLGVGRATRAAQENTGSNPYLTRLREAFLSVTDPSAQNTFSINSMSPVEVGLASILQGSVPVALGITQTLSQPIAAAVAELASIAGWFESESRAGFNRSDLLVLSSMTPATPESLSKDDILVSYAMDVNQHAEMTFGDGIIDGWEVALSILRRLDDEDTRNQTVDEVIEQIPSSDVQVMQRLISLCIDLGFAYQARAVSQRLGDYLAEQGKEYGMALLCYANSHDQDKIQSITDMLNCCCLMESRAWPPDSALDDSLRGLIETPKAAFSNIMETDPEAAAMLQFHVVGYACIRKIFTYRDLLLNPGAQPKGNPGPSERKRLAAKALVAAINSAADSIYGGLYDTNRQAAVSTEMIMPLLGEATAFLAGSDPAPFSNEQIYALLAAVEDLETVSPRIREAAQVTLSNSMDDFHGKQQIDPHEMLKKSISSGTNSNFSFSMMGSAMMASGTSGGQSDGSAVLVGGGSKGSGSIQRAWDWREAFKDVPKEDLMREVLKRLRLGLARALSVGELD